MDLSQVGSREDVEEAVPSKHSKDRPGHSPRRSQVRLRLVNVSRGLPFEAGNQAGQAEGKDGGTWGGTGGKGTGTYAHTPVVPMALGSARWPLRLAT